ncbi:MAG: DUF1015 domain-containing protein [Acidobacteria bacterium]|nr:DUF1015 domain-containing protein [Acidobacteriota bacterium]MCL5288609.1 DUF1015 domain-containing protein [Acidobacteriota bacterium]
MAEIFPFAAWRYNPARVKWESVLTQPYDKITPEMQQRYAALDSNNLIAVEKGIAQPDDSPANNVYTRAAAKLEEWARANVLVQDPVPAIYAYSQEFQLPGGKARRIRRGFIALGRLEDFSAGVIYRHEQTLSAPKADRLELLRHTRAQTGQLFMLYSDPAKRIDALLAEAAHTPPATELRDEYNVVHRLWPITDKADIARITATMAEQKIVIADGHHRYETALAWRDECRAKLGSDNPDAPWERAMMTFVNAQAEGLTILPTHRVVANVPGFDFAAFRRLLEPHFDWYAYPFADAAERATAWEDFRKDYVARGKERRALGLYAGLGAFYLFLLRKDANLGDLLPGVSAAQRGLDVVLLHRFVLEKGLGITAAAVVAEKNIRYVREAEEALVAVDAGAAQMVFLLQPVHVQQMFEIALGGEVLPQKSTDFYPKMLSGIAIYWPGPRTND